MKKILLLITCILFMTWCSGKEVNKANAKVNINKHKYFPTPLNFLFILITPSNITQTNLNIHIIILSYYDNKVNENHMFFQTY